jgi:hypothetical protein
MFANRADELAAKWGYDPMEGPAARADTVGASNLRIRSQMSTTQMIVVAVLSLAVVALLMVRQSQTD